MCEVVAMRKIQKDLGKLTYVMYKQNCEIMQTNKVLLDKISNTVANLESTRFESGPRPRGKAKLPKDCSVR